MKLTELTPAQRQSLEDAHRFALRVLNEIKRRPLKGKDLERMKEIESSVQNLESALLLP
jgi:hypothetical protein